MSSLIAIKENEVDKTVLARYSCNKFSEKQIEEGLLEYILKLTQVFYIKVIQIREHQLHLIYKVIKL